jgi:hypothetical protein
LGPKQLAHIMLHKSHTLLNSPFPINGYVPVGQPLAKTQVEGLPVFGFL